MAEPLVFTSDLLWPLAAFGTLHEGPAAYFGELSRSDDPVLAVGAICALVDNRVASVAQWEEIAAASRYGAVKTRAFAYFQTQFEHGLARRAAEAPAPSAAMAELALMQSELAFDPAGSTQAYADLFLATGALNWLTKASETAELAGGWRESLPWALRAMALAPLDARPLQRVYMVLDDAGQTGLLLEIAELLSSRGLHAPIARIFAATAALQQGDATACLNRLAPLDDKRAAQTPEIAPYAGRIRALRATATEKLGNYREAFAEILALKAAERDPKVDPERFYRGTSIRGALPIPPLPPDPRSDVVQMVGFPRSGTTLLENALAAHQQIETFEEIPALNAAIDVIERVVLGKVPPPADPAETYLAARAKYYEEIDIRRRKPSAIMLVDKMPMRSSDATFLAKLFPDWRYIFSIRHPYDVALSCLRQRFTPNPAMENFRTLEGVARTYDHSMKEWFAHHDMDDPRVHYVRYDRLVTDFEPTVTGVLAFLGVGWEDTVRDFAKAAEARAVKTPSYQKVRQGVGIGVQTSWQKYGFVFQSSAAAPLRKWAEFFGYETG